MSNSDMQIHALKFTACDSRLPSTIVKTSMT